MNLQVSLFIRKTDSPFGINCDGTLGQLHNQPVQFQRGLDHRDPACLLPLDRNVKVLVASLTLTHERIGAIGGQVEEPPVKGFEMIVSPTTAEPAAGARQHWCVQDKGKVSMHFSFGYKSEVAISAIFTCALDRKSKVKDEPRHGPVNQHPGG